MNVLYNISDFCINTSYAEGFGLSTLESMMTGTPVIAPKTGGLTRQVVDHRDGSHNGVALDIDLKTMVGSQTVPYIYEDYVSIENFSEAIYKIFSLSKEERTALEKKVKSYANSEFKHENTIDRWHETMIKTIEDFKSSKNKSNWTIETF